MVQSNRPVRSGAFTAAVLAGLGGVAGLVQDARAAVVIQEVFSGLVNVANGDPQPGTPAYDRSFVQLYNNGNDSVNLGGYLVYSYFPTNVVALRAFDLKPGQSFLLTGQTLTGDGKTPPKPLPVSADQTSGLAVYTQGSGVGLFAPPQGGGTSSNVRLDSVGFGDFSAAYEGTATAALTLTTAAFRTLTGVDTNNNLADFSTSSVPLPQNSASLPEPALAGLAAVATALIVRRKSC